MTARSRFGACVLSCVLALCGLAVIAMGGRSPGGVETPLHAFLLALFGAACWGASNVIVRLAAQAKLAARAKEGKGEPLSMTRLVVWSSMVPPLPLLLLSLLLDSPAEIAAAVRSGDRRGRRRRRTR